MATVVADIIGAKVQYPGDLAVNHMERNQDNCDSDSGKWNAVGYITTTFLIGGSSIFVLIIHSMSQWARREGKRDKSRDPIEGVVDAVHIRKRYISLNVQHVREILEAPSLGMLGYAKRHLFALAAALFAISYHSALSLAIFGGIDCDKEFFYIMAAYIYAVVGWSLIAVLPNVAMVCLFGRLLLLKN